MGQPQFNGLVRHCWIAALSLDSAVALTDDSSFYGLGGDIVTAGLLSQAFSRHGLQLSVEDVMQYPTLQQQVVALSDAPAESLRGA